MLEENKKKDKKRKKISQFFLNFVKYLIIIKKNSNLFRNPTHFGIDLNEVRSLPASL